MTKILLENIDNVPALSQSVQEVEKVYQDPESTLEDMQKAVEKDPLLVASILKIVNAPMYGLASAVTDIKQAISLLGKDAVRTFVLSTVVDTNFTIDLSPYNMTQEQFAKACQTQMSLMINWVGRKTPKSLSVLGPASFLVDIGRVIIAKTLIEDNKTDIIQKALLAGEDISTAEKTACGAQTTDVTATLFTKWELDPNINHIIRYSDDPEGASLPEEITMAAQLKAVRETVLPNGDITEESVAVAKDTIEEFSLDMEGYEKALDKVLGD